MSTEKKARAAFTSAQMAFGKIFVEADKLVDRANIVASRKAHEALIMLERLILALDIQITTTNWVSTYREPTREAMRDSGRYTDDSLTTVLGRHYRAAVALSHGIKPLDGEAELAYVKRTQEECVKQKWLVLNNTGGARAGKAAAKVTKATKDQRAKALSIVVGANKADQDMVAFLVKHHLDKIRALYASVVKPNEVK